MLALVSPDFDKVAVYGLAEKGASLCVVDNEPGIIQGILEAALAALDAIPTVEAEALTAQHQAALAGIPPFADISM